MAWKCDWAYFQLGCDGVTYHSNIALMTHEEEGWHDTTTHLEDILIAAEGRHSRIDSIHHQLSLVCSTLRSLRRYSDRKIPVIRLPNEIITKIFLSTLDDDAIKENWRQNCVRKAQERRPNLRMVLRAVCQAWRNVALTLENQWKSVEIPSSRLSESDRSFVLRCDDNLNLHVELSAHKKLLKPLLSRCKSLHLTAVHEHSLCHGLTAIEDDLPELESLSLVKRGTEYCDLELLESIEGKGSRVGSRCCRMSGMPALSTCRYNGTAHFSAI